MRIFLLGASGGVGQCLLGQGTARGHSFTAQTRTAGRVDARAGVEVAVGSPVDPDFLARHLPGHDAAVMCTGVDRLGATTLFSDTTRALLAAMGESGVRRLVAITGVGAGETRGHGGRIYNRVVFPLFTRPRYADKDRQEALIAASGLDWTIVRPAAFAARSRPGPLRVATEIPADLQLTSVTRAEVATFILDALEAGTFLGARPFIGHP